MCYYYYYYYYERKWLRWRKIKRLQGHLTVSDRVVLESGSSSFRHCRWSVSPFHAVSVVSTLSVKKSLETMAAIEQYGNALNFPRANCSFPGCDVKLSDGRSRMRLRAHQSTSSTGLNERARTTRESQTHTTRPCSVHPADEWCSRRIRQSLNNAFSRTTQRSGIHRGNEANRAVAVDQSLQHFVYQHEPRSARSKPAYVWKFNCQFFKFPVNRLDFYSNCLTIWQHYFYCADIARLYLHVGSYLLGHSVYLPRCYLALGLVWANRNVNSGQPSWKFSISIL